MPAFSLTPVNAFPQMDGTEFPQPLRFSQDDVLFVGPITQVNFIGGTVTEDGMGKLNVTLGGGGVTVPGNPEGSFQFNELGGFAGTAGLVNLELYSLSFERQADVNSQPLVAFQSTNTDGAFLSGWNPQWLDFFLDVVSRGQQYMTTAHIGVRTFSTVTYPPDTGNLATLDQPAVWIGGSNDNSINANQCYDAWFLPWGMSFAQRDAQATYTKFEPMVRKGTPATPTAFDTAIQVKLDGANYWLPLILQ